MSRKSSKNPQPAPSGPASSAQRASAAPNPARRRGLVIGAGAALVAALGGGAYLALGGRDGQASRPGLASTHAPSLGPATAKVHIVEFLDPACETCAAFYPLVKRMMADNRDRIRLSARLVPFHPGVEDVVRMLEASRAQNLFWPALEALLVAQDSWVFKHVAQPAVARQLLAGVGLQPDRLDADMRTPEVGQRMAQDSQGAALLQVTKTPEYFVNGRQMASFGRRQLQDLVRDALQRAYS